MPRPDPDVAGSVPEHRSRSCVASPIPGPRKGTPGVPSDIRNRGIMATRQHHQIVETPTEARQAELGPSVLALLVVSTGLAVLILGVVWFVLFRT
jgi:hypothetical protein